MGLASALEQYDSLSRQINRLRIKKNSHLIVFSITSKHVHSSVNYVLYDGSQSTVPRRALRSLEIPVKNRGEVKYFLIADEEIFVLQSSI